MSRNGARPKSPKRALVHQGEYREKKMASLMDDIAEFEEFRETTLKAIRKDIKAGMNAKAIREKYISILQGRLITDALTTEDIKEAFSIIKDIADRVEGKAKEQQEVTHRLEKLSDKELDALLQSEEEALERMHKQFQN